jgi:hypothetical protein
VLVSLLIGYWALRRPLTLVLILPDLFSPNPEILRAVSLLYDIVSTYHACKGRAQGKYPLRIF